MPLLQHQWEQHSMRISKFKLEDFVLRNRFILIQYVENISIRTNQTEPFAVVLRKESTFATQCHMPTTQIYVSSVCETFDSTIRYDCRCNDYVCSSIFFISLFSIRYRSRFISAMCERSSSFITVCCSDLLSGNKADHM